MSRVNKHITQSAYLSVAGAWLQSRLQDLLGDLAFGFADDWLFAAETVQEVLAKVQTGLERIRKSGFLLNPEKWEFLVSPMTYLGRVLEMT
jgi:hypothetical protein